MCIRDSLAAHPDGRFTRVLSGEHTPLDVPASQRVELRALLGLRDTAKQAAHGGGRQRPRHPGDGRAARRAA